MGAAAYNRGSKVVARQAAESARPVEFEIIERLNALPKFEDAGTPFGPVHFVASHGGVFAECPVTGFGYWYPTLHETTRRWRVVVTGYDATIGAYIATPQAGA